MNAAFLLGQCLLAYLLGSVSGSLLLGRWRGIDIRRHGSGNAGGTNALRVAGWRFALGVVLIDLGKGVVATLLGAWSPDAIAVPVSADWRMAGCALAAVIGHCWPVFYGFRGGKGAATAVGSVLVLAPGIAVAMVLFWLAVLAAWRYVGLATMLCALAFPVFVLLARLGGIAMADSLLVYAVAIAILISFTHRENFRRMRAGTEPRLGSSR
jgi:glycerol-3-phosphate acyltransferase PlsY